MEVKLGPNRVDEGAHNLLALRKKLSPEANATCGALLVLVADTPTYTWHGEPDTPQIEEQEFPRYERR